LISSKETFYKKTAASGNKADAVTVYVNAGKARGCCEL
jgi:hypothetical protein